MRAGRMPEPNPSRLGNAGENSPLVGGYRARTVRRGHGRSRSQSSRKSEEAPPGGGGSAPGRGWKAVNSSTCLCHLLLLPRHGPAGPGLVPDACRCGTTGSMWGFLGWGCGSSRVWAFPQADVHPGLTLHPRCWGSLAGQPPPAEGLVPDQIPWAGGRTLGQATEGMGRDCELWKRARWGNPDPKDLWGLPIHPRPPTQAPSPPAGPPVAPSPPPPTPLQRLLESCGRQRFLTSGRWSSAPGHQHVRRGQPLAL